MAVNLVGAGIAEGVTRGLQGVTEGLKQADTIQYQRELRRQQAVQFETQQTQAEQQIQQQALQIQALQKQMYGDSLKQALINFKTLGGQDFTGINSIFKSNPALTNQLFGDLTKLESTNDYSDDTLLSMGYDPSIMKDKSRYAVALETNGNRTLIDLDKLALSMGVTGYLQGKELEASKQQIEQKELSLRDKQVEVYNAYAQDLFDKEARGEIPAEEVVKQLRALNAKYSATVQAQQFKQQQIEQKQRLRSDIVSKKISLTPENFEQAILGDTEGQKEDFALSSLNNNLDLFNTNKSFADYLVNQARRTQIGQQFARAVSSNAELQGLLTNMKESVTAIQDKGWNPNIVSTAWESLRSYLPSSLANYSVEDLEKKAGSQNFQGAFVTLLKLISGTAVSASEAERFNSFLGSIKQNKETILGGLEAFVNNQLGKVMHYYDISPALATADFGSLRENLKLLKGSITNAKNSAAKSNKGSKEPASNLYRQGGDNKNDLSTIYRDDDSLKSITGATK